MLGTYNTFLVREEDYDYYLLDKLYDDVSNIYDDILDDSRERLASNVQAHQMELAISQGDDTGMRHLAGKQ